MTDDIPAAVAGLLDARPLTPDDRAFHELRKELDRALEATRRVASLRVVAAVTHLARLVHADPGDEINAAVRAALEADDGPEAAWMLEDDNRTRGELARDVRAVLRLAVAGLAPLLPDGLVTPDGLVDFEVMHGITSWPDSIPTEDTPTGPVTAWDAAMVATLEAEELATPEEAAGLRARRANSYARHTDAGRPGDALAWWWSPAPERHGKGRPVVLLGDLAERLWARRWRERVRRKIEAEERARRNAPGLPLRVHVPLGDSLVDAIHEAGRIVRKGDTGRQLPLSLAAVDATALDALPLRALGKLTAHRLVRWMIQAAHVGYYLTVDAPVELVEGVTTRRGATGVDLVVVGGLSRLAVVVGAGSKKATGDLRDALNVLSRVTLDWSGPDSEGGGSLVTWRGPGAKGEHPSPGNPSTVAITVSDVLCPGMASRIRGNADALVVPVLDVPAMPPKVSNRSHGKLARFDWLVTRQMVERSREAVGSGGVVLNLDQIGREAGLRREHVAAAVDYWTTDTDAPARWERDGSRYMLADRPPTAQARRWILEGAALRDGRAKAGRESGRKRRLKIDGAGKARRK